MAHKYKVTFISDAKALAVILPTVEGSATLLGVELIVEPVHEEKIVKKTFTYQGGKRDKGISGPDLILQILTEAKCVVPMADITKKFVSLNFSKNSAPAAISSLVNEGKVKRVGPGLYSL